MSITITYKLAETQKDFAQAKILFKEYADTLEFDLAFQNFNEELKDIAKQYSTPTGGLFLAQAANLSVGCAGIRKLDEETAELKRMFVKNEFRGSGIGMELLKLSIDPTKNLGYKKLRLDTLLSMTKAMALYSSFGFYEIAPYRFNPLQSVVYMEKTL